MPHSKPAPSRNHAALVLFGRTVVTTLGLTSAVLGTIAGARAQSGNYDPYSFATGIGALFAGACAVIAFLLMRRRALLEKIATLETRVDELADRNWELREAEERSRGLLEALGDLIVRRDKDGRICYANDAYCSLAGKPRAALLGSTFTLPVLEQGETTVFADGTRVHDQKIADGTS